MSKKKTESKIKADRVEKVTKPKAKDPDPTPTPTPEPIPDNVEKFPKMATLAFKVDPEISALFHEAIGKGNVTKYLRGVVNKTIEDHKRREQKKQQTS